MAFLELPMIGSFQDERVYFSSDDAVAEVWARVGRFASINYLRAKLRASTDAIPLEQLLLYGHVRVKQSLEFRNAAKAASLLTAPLPNYYSFLNLTRAFLALGPDVIAKNAHGLRFHEAKDLLGSSAEITRGTFSDYLEAYGFKWNEGDSFTLKQALAHIAEIEYDFHDQFPGESAVVPIVIKATMKGSVSLIPQRFKGDLGKDWRASMPGLAGHCEYKEGVLTVRAIHQASYEDVAKFAAENLLPSLRIKNHALWYAIREDLDLTRLPRAGYYLVAMFILGSAVRYAPELMLKVTQEESECQWLLERFLSAADMHFPQLKLMEFWKRQVYFAREGA